MRWMGHLFRMLFGVSDVKPHSHVFTCAPSNAVLVCALAHLAAPLLTGCEPLSSLGLHKGASQDADHGK